MNDNLGFFADNQVITATALSTVIDMGLPATDVNGNPAPADPGQSPLYIEARVTADFATCTSVAIEVEESDNADGSSGVILLETPAIVVAELVEGYKFALGSLPAGITKRFLALNFVVAGDDATTGKISAYLTPNPHAV